VGWPCSPASGPFPHPPSPPLRPRARAPANDRRSLLRKKGTVTITTTSCVKYFERLLKINFLAFGYTAVITPIPADLCGSLLRPVPGRFPRDNVPPVGPLELLAVVLLPIWSGGRHKCRGGRRCRDSTSQPGVAFTLTRLIWVDGFVRFEKEICIVLLFVVGLGLLRAIIGIRSGQEAP
jgi:hypothetical protein